MDQWKKERLPTWDQSPERAWLSEFLGGVFPDVGGKVSADFHLALAMCRAEPKLAQVALQFLAQELREARAPEDGMQFLRFALGVLFISYCRFAQKEGRLGDSGIPPELELAVRSYPEILACANALVPSKRA